jgi:hypothetical protein
VNCKRVSTYIEDPLFYDIQKMMHLKVGGLSWIEIMHREDIPFKSRILWSGIENQFDSASDISVVGAYIEALDFAELREVWCYRWRIYPENEGVVGS